VKQPKPWFRASKSAWYVEHQLKQVRLGEHPDGAPPPRKSKAGWNAPPAILDAFYKLMATDPANLPKPDKILAAVVCDLFLDHSQQHHAPDTFANYRHFLRSFCKAYGRTPAAELKPFHVTRWLDAQPGQLVPLFGGQRHGVLLHGGFLPIAPVELIGGQPQLESVNRLARHSPMARLAGSSHLWAGSGCLMMTFWNGGCPPFRGSSSMTRWPTRSTSRLASPLMTSASAAHEKLAPRERTPRSGPGFVARYKAGRRVGATVVDSPVVIARPRTGRSPARRVPFAAVPRSDRDQRSS